MTSAGFSINYDSLRTILPKQYTYEKIDNNLSHDPCYFAVLERYIELSQKYNFKFSAFVVGKDLENYSIAKQVKFIFNEGHEIGNHTYSHLTDLIEKPSWLIKSEIKRAHFLIANITEGVQPKGFVAPSWGLCKDIIKELNSLGYIYDTSLFPSYMMPFLQLKLKIWSLSNNTNNNFNVLRKDVIGNLVGSTKPYYSSESNPWGIRFLSEGILCLPLPTIFPRIPFWHSWAFRVSNRTYEKWIRKAIKNNPFFYLVTHPADLIDPDKDLCKYPSSLLKFERMNVPLKIKLEKIKIAIDVILSERKIIRMDKLAQLAENRIRNVNDKKINNSC